MSNGTRRGWGVGITSRPLFTSGKDPVPIVQEAGWAPGPVWRGAENLTPTGIRSPDCPACSQSLYRLWCPAHNKWERHSLNKETWMWFGIWLEYEVDQLGSCPGLWDVTGTMWNMVLALTHFHTPNNFSKNHLHLGHAFTKMFASPVLG